MSSPSTRKPGFTSAGAASKPMSNRLLTMKFMQRAAASSPHSKKESAAIKVATAQETARREAASLALRSRALGSSDKDTETHWELSYVRDARQNESGLKVVAGVGLSELHNESSEEGEGVEGEEKQEEKQEEKEEECAGRLVFGNFRKKELQIQPKAENSDDDSDGSGSDKGTPRQKLYSLRGLKSISNPGNQAYASTKCNKCGTKGHKVAECPKSECYACGGFGHLSNDCPNPRRKRKAEGRWDSQPKRSRSSM